MVHQILLLLLAGYTSTIAGLTGPFDSREPDKTEPMSGMTVTQVLDKSKWKIQRPEEVRDVANRLLALGEAVEPTGDVELVLLETDHTPYLSHQVVQTPVWHMTIHDWSIKPKSFPSFSDHFERILDIFVDPVDGKLLRLETRWPESEPAIIPRPTAASATDQLKRGGEVYHGFPTDPPKVSFISALESLVRAGESVAFARQIIGNHVVWSGSGRWTEPRPVWAITLYGLNTTHGSRGPSKYPVYVWRCIVDAKTGKYLTATNSPGSDRPKFNAP